MNKTKKLKRENGQGSISMRKDGRWMAKIQLGNKPNGKPNIKTFCGKTEAEARRKMKEYKKEFDKNDYTEIQKITVEEYMNRWLYEIKSGQLKPSSFDRKEITLNNQVYPYIGNIQIGSLTADDIQNMIGKLTKKGFAYSTIKKAYETVNGCFRNAAIKHEVKYNPALGVELPTNTLRETEDIDFYTEDQLKRIFEEATRRYGNGAMIYRQGYAIILLANTGMRIGELLALRQKDINREEKTISITRNTVVVKNRDSDSHAKKNIMIDQDKPKTKAGRRTIAMNDDAYNAVLELSKLNLGSEKLISSKNRKPTHPRNIDRMFRDILKRCDLPSHGVHALRHTYASLLFAQGVDIKEISYKLGHADINITYNTYIHLIPEKHRKAYELFSNTKAS